MDIKLEQKKYRIPKRYRPLVIGGAAIVAVLAWLALGNFSSTLRVDAADLA